MAATPAQLHELLAYCMDFAQTMLRDSGEFYSFGAVLSPEGKVVVVGEMTGTNIPTHKKSINCLLRPSRLKRRVARFSVRHWPPMLMFPSNMNHLRGMRFEYA